MGGGMRQVGSLAAAGLHALDHHIERLAQDHANAALLADAIGATAPTNIVVADVPDAVAIVAAAREEGVWVSAVGPTTVRAVTHLDVDAAAVRSEEHTSELQSLMRISYAVFCLKKKKQH